MNAIVVAGKFTMKRWQFLLAFIELLCLKKTKNKSIAFSDSIFYCGYLMSNLSSIMIIPS